LVSGYAHVLVAVICQFS